MKKTEYYELITLLQKMYKYSISKLFIMVCSYFVDTSVTDAINISNDIYKAFPELFRVLRVYNIVTYYVYLYSIGIPV